MISQILCIIIKYSDSLIKVASSFVMSQDLASSFVISQELASFYVISQDLELFYVISQDLALFYVQDQALSFVISQELTSFCVISQDLASSFVISQDLALFDVISQDLALFYVISQDMICVLRDITRTDIILRDITRTGIILRDITRTGIILRDITRTGIILRDITRSERSNMHVEWREIGFGLFFCYITRSDILISVRISVRFFYCDWSKHVLINIRKHNVISCNFFQKNVKNDSNKKRRIRIWTCVQKWLHRFSLKNCDIFYRKKQLTADYWQPSELLLSLLRSSSQQTIGSHPRSFWAFSEE